MFHEHITQGGKELMKFVKKLTALFLAVVMVMAMGITAFAADPITLTIDKAEQGHTYKVYQILTGDLTGLSNDRIDGLNDPTEQGRLSNMKPGSNVLDTYKASGTTQKDYKDATDKILKALAQIEDGAEKTDANGNYILKTGADLSDAAYALINTSSTPVATVVGDGSAKKVEGLATGYYIITDEYTSAGSSETTLSRNVVTLVGSTTITPKNEKPSIDKKIANTNDANKPIDGTTAKTNTAAIGDTINYEITGKVPNTDGYKYYYYVVSDELSEGLTLDQDSIKVYIGDVQDSNLRAKYDSTSKTGDYTVAWIYAEDNTTVIGFKLGFVNIKGLVDAENNGVNVGDAITVKYDATLNENAAVGIIPNTNDVQLIYSNDPKKSEVPEEPDTPGQPPEEPDDDHPTGETPKVTTKTYTTEIELSKVNEKNAVLTGAQFTLTGTNLNTIKFVAGDAFEKVASGETGYGDTYYLLKDGTYTKTPKTTEGVDANDYVDTTDTYKKVTVLKATTVAGSDKSISAFVDPTTGKVTFKGLNAGTYTLTETVTPSGYNTIDPIKFEIKGVAGTPATAGEASPITWSITMDSSNKDTTFKFNADKTAPTDGTEAVEDGTFSATVINKPGTLLPSTGGMGTTVIYAAGIALIVAAGVVVIVKKRFA